MADATVLTVEGVGGSKIGPVHLRRDAYVYVRESSVMQVREHTDSLQRQYELAERAVELGWPTSRVVAIEEDLDRSGARSPRSAPAWPATSASITP